MNELVDSPGLEFTERKPWHWPTVLFAALPATFLAFLAGLAILVGFFLLITMKPAGIPMFIGGVLGWAGMLSLWAAARSSGVLTKWTARGLAGGVIGNLIFIGFKIFHKDLDTSQWTLLAALTIGPLLFSISYLRRYWKQPRPVEQGESGDPLLTETQSAAMCQTLHPAARPFNEGRMRRILVLLLIIPAILELIYVPSTLKSSPGLGLLLVLGLVFPFYLGIVVTAVWCFWRSRALRWLAGATLLTPLLLPWVLRLTANQLGHEVAAQIAFYTLVATPILVVLFLPKQVAGYMPQWIVDGRGFNKIWVVLQSIMLIPWVILIPGAIMLDSDAGDYFKLFLAWHLGASIIVAAISLVMAYIGLRAQQRPQTSLRFAQIGLSVLHLIIAAPIVVAIGLIFALAGLG